MSSITDESDDDDELAMGLALKRAAKTLVAKLALAGHTVHQDRFGGFIVSRWGVSRFCMDYESLKLFAQQVGIK